MKSPGNLLIAAAALLAVGSIGCQAPGAVTGVFGGEEFALHCETPLATSDASGRDSVVVLSEATAETLSTVNIRLHGVNDLALDAPVDVGAADEGVPSIQVVVGELVAEQRADGVEILSAANPVRAASIDGTLTLESRDDVGLAGTFRAELDDGGFVEGFFDASNTH